MDPVSEIKARLPIEELVGQYCQIQKKGRNFVCLCPFHNDTRPSLTVSPDKGIAYCFPCQKGGDIFSFYQEIEGVDFRQAIKDLAEKTGVELPREKAFTPGPTKDEKIRLRECLEEAALFYKVSLNENEKAIKYLTDRSISPEISKSFAIGYAPDSFDATYTHLLKKGFSRSEIMKAGLGIQKELQEERIYDRFRNRLMFPILDVHANIIGFGGRTLGEDDAKYINSPDGPLYNKSTALYGISHAKEAIRKTKTVIMVEGYFDVLAFHRIGIKNVVAASGTALTEQHALILKRTADRVLLCFDQDAAGEDAAERAFLLCKAQDLDVRSLIIPAGKDPDECVNNAPDALKGVCEEGGIPYLDALFAKLKESKMEKRAILQKIMPLVNSIPSAVEKEEAVKNASEFIGTTITALEDDLKKESQIAKKREEEKSREAASPFQSTQILLGLFLTYPAHLSITKEMLEPEEENLLELYHALKDLAEKNAEDIKPDDLPESIREKASILQLYCEEHFGTWSEEKSKVELKSLCRKVNQDTLRTKQMKLIEEIKSARDEGKKLDEEKLLTQYQKVLKLTAMTG